MKTGTKKYGAQDERTAAAKAKLLDATIALVAERGPLGFSLADVGARAGVSRGLPGHHFHSREALLGAAVTRLASHTSPVDGAELGLPALLDWLRRQLGRAERGEPEPRALLHLLLAPGSDALATLVAQSGEQQAAGVRRHLEQARALQQVRSDLDPATTAAVLLGQLNGELLRLAAGGEAMSEVFIDLIGHALGPAARDGGKSRKPAQGEKPPAKARQRGLFGE
jgi:AcrR family transcriptional regulator